MNTYLGIEFGSTRIKAVLIDENYNTVFTGDYTWVSRYENGIWTYDLEEALKGLKCVLKGIEKFKNIKSVGISGMMHGYLPFDKDWNLLSPFRTWQNINTAEAAEELSALFGFSIPRRWSIAHLYQCILEGHAYIGKIAHITTLAGYIHHMLTGEHAVGAGEGSGIFPIDNEKLCYNEEMLKKFNSLPKVSGLPWRLSDLLPEIIPAGCTAGTLTSEGAALADNLLPAGVPFAPPEGDADTGMVASGAVAPGTGSLSAGTSLVCLSVLHRPLKKAHGEINIFASPTGKPVAMIHGGNCTNDTNAWVKVLNETAELFGAKPSTGELYTRLYEKALEGDADCGGITVCPFITGEGIIGLDEGRPMVIRTPDCNFTLANFFRAQLYSSLAAARLGLGVLEEEGVKMNGYICHGGLFKTPKVGQKIAAAALQVPVTCMDSAGEGGPFGMALLAAYCIEKQENESLEDYLANRVFGNANGVTVEPDSADVQGFNTYFERFKRVLEVERKAVEVVK